MPSQTIPVLSQAALPFRKLTVSDVTLLAISDRITSLSIKMMILEVKSPSLPRLQTFRRNLSSHRTSLKDWFLNYFATMVAHEHARMHRSSRKRRPCLWDIRYSPPGHLRYWLTCWRHSRTYAYSSRCRWTSMMRVSQPFGILGALAPDIHCDQTPYLC